MTFARTVLTRPRRYDPTGPRGHDGRDGGDAFRIRDGVVTTEATYFDDAIDAVAREKLRGVIVTSDFGDKGPNPPSVDLSRLLAIPFIDEFGRL